MDGTIGATLKWDLLKNVVKKITKCELGNVIFFRAAAYDVIQS